MTLAERAVQAYAHAASGLFTILGIVGLLKTHFNGFADSDGVALISFTVNPLMNLVHLLAGLVGIAMAVRPGGARRYALMVGAIGVPFALIGFALTGSNADIFARDRGMVVLQLAVAVVGLAAWVWSRAAAAEGSEPAAP